MFKSYNSTFILYFRPKEHVNGTSSKKAKDLTNGVHGKCNIIHLQFYVSQILQCLFNSFVLRTTLELT